MKPPDPCEPLEKLVDKLNEQLDALCSQSQEHLFLEGLIDVRGLTEATRAMLKDAEGRLANCRRHPAPPSNRPFLVTFTDSNCSRGSAEAHQGSRSAKAYWSAWADVRIEFPYNDLRRVPEHWRTFGTRHSLLTGSPRFAVNPPNAILNYLYAVLESEASLAAAVVGLDPGLGVLHMDTKTRDSLACDIMEPIRAEVDAFVLDWIGREPLRRADFFETETGNCRLMSSLCRKLSETAAVWGKLVAPWAEHVARTLWGGRSKSKITERLSTPLTQQHKREAKGSVVPSSVLAPRPQKVCRGCGAVLEQNQRNHCALCGVSISRANMLEIAKKGRLASRSIEARERQSAAQKRQRAARRGWLRSSLPAWLTQSSYREVILPRLSAVTVPTLAQALKVSEPYATKIRKGQHVPHPMHWQALADLVGVVDFGGVRS
jgi:hypothetical protein